ncbi:MAG: isochorismatase family protein [Clostridia bacterium]|nr:isochorismatase family protein [Clostridia bacterium]
MKNVLIVVDMQNDFVSGSLGTKEAQAIETAVCEKIMAFDGKVYATLDTHGEDYLETQEGRRLPVKHCIAGTTGWAPTAAVGMALASKADNGKKTKPAEGELMMEDCFVMKEGFGSADLPFRILEEVGEDLGEITLIGLCTDICVIANAMILKSFFPENRIVVDSSCCAGVTPESHETALNAMRACQIDVI